MTETTVTRTVHPLTLLREFREDLQDAGYRVTAAASIELAETLLVNIAMGVTDVDATSTALHEAVARAKANAAKSEANGTEAKPARTRKTAESAK